MTLRLDRFLLAALLLGHLVLLSTQPGTEGSLLAKGTLVVIGPVAHSVDAMAGGIESTLDHFRLGSSLRRENQQLSEEVAVLRRQLVRLHGVEEELERLAVLSDYARIERGSFVADVVYADHDSWLRTLILYTGRERSYRNQPVITDQGLVGRVTESAGRYAKVLLLTDRSASASAMIQRTRRRGMVRGDDAKSLWLENIPLGADSDVVHVGDRVVTAGIDGVFPRGIPIGRVTSVEPGPDGLFYRIRVAPAIDLGLLEQVYVLTEEIVPAEVKGMLSDGGGGR